MPAKEGHIIVESTGTIITEQTDNQWRAHFSSNPGSVGVGSSESEAVASLYISQIGKLILQEPERFGLRIRKRPVEAIQKAFKLLNVQNFKELSLAYTAEDQRLFKSGEWDDRSPALITNQIKDILESINPDDLDDEERDWRQEILWFWYHHAISCALWKYRAGTYRSIGIVWRYSEKALELQPPDHPNKITKLLCFLVRKNLVEAEVWAERHITDEVEQVTARELIEEYKNGKFFKK